MSLFLIAALFLSKPLKDGAFVGTVCILRLIQDGEELKVLGLSNGIEFVRMALCACHCDSHPYSHGGVDAINDGNVSELFIVGTTFVIGERIAVKGGGYQLFVGGIGEQVPCKLLDRELIEWHSFVDGLDDPIAVRPNRTLRIVCIAR